MPRSANDAVIADIVAAADQLPAKLISFLKFIPDGKADSHNEDRIRSNLDKIVILLREQYGHDFSLYKRNTLIRRIERRKGIHQLERMSSYVRLLQENPQEVEILFKELLIGVTSFFRDASVWETLRDIILPSMLTNLPDGHVLRAWVPGCSTGEEAYSLVIVFKEAMGKAGIRKNLTLQVFATDLDQDAIEIARKGFYTGNISADVAPERLSAFFVAEGEGYRICNAIREMVVFAPQNVIKDPPFTKLDLLTCRNMLIYMESALQKKLITLFNYSLNPGGIMVLGTAETLGSLTEGFEEIDARHKIFRRTTTSFGRELTDFPSSFFAKKATLLEKMTSSAGVENIQSLADQILLQCFAPASVLVNSLGDIVYITGRTGKYLEPAAGKANLNIFSMAREGLREVLPGAFRRAGLSFNAVILNNIRIGTNGGAQVVDVTVQRIESPDPIKGMLMVVFTDVPAWLENSSMNTKTGKHRSTGRVKELELELRRNLEELQSTREEMQTSQEELKSMNEELQSTNEELQSTNEELTTSKEEMQSLNEELQTVNIELQSKLGDFMRAGDDMKNLLNSTEIATLFLDKDLNIRRFTDQLTSIFKIRPTDIGRPFTDLVTDLQYPDMDNHARQVLKSLTFTETAIEIKHGQWFNVRIMPYRTLDDRIDGLVMTFTKITNLKRLETEYEKACETRKLRESEKI